MPDGKPVIGPVPGLSNMFLATGHEGEGHFLENLKKIIKTRKG